MLALTAAFVLVVAIVLLFFPLGRTPRGPALPGADPPALPPPREPHVVLVHGFAGFDELRVGRMRAAYFRGVRARLDAMGVACTAARLPAVASLAERAAALESLLASLADYDVHVIAHSMGGLDARRAVRAMGGGPVRSLVTIATPHRGTPLAAWHRAIPGRLPALHDLVALDDGRDDLADVAGVRYASVVARPSRGASGVHPLLRGSYLWLRAVAGENDGVVPVESQVRGEVLATIDADHWGAIGWSSAFDAPAFYERLAADLGCKRFIG